MFVFAVWNGRNSADEVYYIYMKVRARAHTHTHPHVCACKFEETHVVSTPFLVFKSELLIVHVPQNMSVLSSCDEKHVHVTHWLVAFPECG